MTGNRVERDLDEWGREALAKCLMAAGSWGRGPLPLQQFKPNSDQSNLEALCKRSLELYVSVNINASPQGEAVNALVQAVTAVVQMLVLRQRLRFRNKAPPGTRRRRPSSLTSHPVSLPVSLLCL